jgi:hypothetical protein
MPKDLESKQACQVRHWSKTEAFVIFILRSSSFSKLAGPEYGESQNVPLLTIQYLVKVLRIQNPKSQIALPGTVPVPTTSTSTMKQILVRRLNQDTCTSFVAFLLLFSFY